MQSAFESPAVIVPLDRVPPTGLVSLLVAVGLGEADGPLEGEGDDEGLLVGEGLALGDGLPLADGLLSGVPLPMSDAPGRRGRPLSRSCARRPASTGPSANWDSW